MNFPESEAHLLSLGNEVEAMKLGLNNIRTLLAALHEPQNNYLKVQVAGTNGKGSVCVFLNSICVQVGIKTGLYTSPHLVSITERIKIDGQDISERDFARHATKVRETAENLLADGKIEYRPTFFEQVTAIALAAFAEEKVELAILETGLGGRLDATTAANAEIAAITRIDIDHQEYLGETLAEIAAEKAAIIHSGSRVVIGEQKREAEQIIRGRCRELGIEPNLATTDIVTKKYDEDSSYPIRSTSFRTARGNYPNIVLGLAGKHQEENAAVTIAIVEELKDVGFKVSEDEVWLGLETARHPGRLEFENGFLFDGAHNAAGARALRSYLDEFVKEPITMIFGSMKDKDIDEIARILFPKAETLILTRPDNSRGLTATELAEFVPAKLDRSVVFLTETVSEALDETRRLANNGLILVTGSLYLIGEAQKILKAQSQI